MYVDIDVHKKNIGFVLETSVWVQLKLHDSDKMYILEAAVKSNHVSKRFLNLFKHPKERVALTK